MKMATLEGSRKTIDDALIKAFKNSIQCEVLSEGESDYDEARVIYNGMFNIKPALIVRTITVDDVVKTVNFARDNNILLAVKGGGHSVAGKCLSEGGITIDLRPMNDVQVDPEARTARVGGGTLLGEMDKATQEYGLAAPGGIVSDTGVAGLTLGAGFGWLRGKYGFSIDNLLSVDIVTADGQFRHASVSENEDLFWAVRGGSGNFGVVTTFEFRLHPVGPELMFCGPMYPAENAKSIIAQWRDFVTQAPDEFSSLLIMMTVPEFDIFPEEIQGKDAIMLAGVHCGTVEEGGRFIKPLREMGELLFDLSGPKKYTEIQSMFDSPLPQGSMICYFTSLYLETFNDEAVDTLIKSFDERPAKLIPFLVEDLRGASMRVPADKTAFGDRSAPYRVELNSAWLDPKESDSNIVWTRENMDKFKSFSSGRTYLNHSGLNEEGEELVKRAYGVNYERLRQIKKKYDPGNLFRLNQNISPA
ncbi:MAG: FAD-linked oxidase [Thermodesulfobacteriota bacterium]|nr:MAG: FAD-linked oxidase [Thermodesulfobacteriota bacterium]